MAKVKKKRNVSKPAKKPRPNNGLGNIFRTVLLASMRAKELFMGGKPLIGEEKGHPCIIAINEIKEGKIKYKEIKK